MNAGARRDEDGYLWVTGRVDDMLNVSGHLMSTAEVESVLTEHESVSEAAVVSRPHPVKGECLYCFITPNQGVTFTDKMVAELKTKGLFQAFYKLSQEWGCMSTLINGVLFDRFVTLQKTKSYITCILTH